MKSHERRISSLEAETVGKWEPRQSIIMGPDQTKEDVLAQMGSTTDPDKIFWIRLVPGEFPD